MTYPRLDTLPEPAQQVLGLYEVFRRLGFESDDLHLISDSTGIGALVLRTQGREFSVTTDCTDPRLADKQEAEVVWAAASALWNSEDVPDADKLAIYEATRDKLDALGLLITLDKYGIEVPVALANRPAID